MEARTGRSVHARHGGTSLRLGVDLRQFGLARTTVALSLTSGARQAEIISLRWAQIDFNRHVITLQDTKHGELVGERGPNRLTCAVNLTVNGSGYVTRAYPTGMGC